MKFLWSRLVLPVAASAGLFALPFGEARADVISATGTGYNVSVNLSLSLVNGGIEVDASAGPTSYSSITAPPPYSSQDSVASLTVSQGSILLVGTLLGADTGVLTSAANSTVDGSNLTGATSASATVNDLSLNVLSLLTGTTVLSISADAVTSSTSVDGGYGALAGTGTANFTNLSINLLGTNIATINGEVDANTGIDVHSILGGVTVLLNEQISTGDGVGSFGYTTNAIHVKFDNVGISGVGTLNGDLIISHADALQNAVPVVVPEPSSLALIGLGGVGSLLLARFRRRS